MESLNNAERARAVLQLAQWRLSRALETGFGVFEAERSRDGALRTAARTALGSGDTEAYFELIRQLPDRSTPLRVSTPNLYRVPRMHRGR